jgi:hypothetical protein
MLGLEPINVNVTAKINAQNLNKVGKLNQYKVLCEGMATKNPV